jgi:hypothetical protein
MHHIASRIERSAMKREHVIPDLLASMTADALFGGTKPSRPAPPVGKQRSVFNLRRWFKSAEGWQATASKPPESPATRVTLDDDWVGGWYARTRLLQASTLAQLRERPAGAVSPTAGTAEPDRRTSTVDVITQIKDFS